MVVEAIHYTQAPLQNEKAHVIDTAIFDIIAAISRQEERLDVIEQYTHQYLKHIQLFETQSISFAELLQRIQPLQMIPYMDGNNEKIESFNAIISQMNALRDTQHHEIVFRGLALRIQELLHPEKMSLLQQFDYN